MWISANLGDNFAPARRVETRNMRISSNIIELPQSIVIHKFWINIIVNIYLSVQNDGFGSGGNMCPGEKHDVVGRARALCPIAAG
jgi:hypothetical protein